MSSLGSDEEGDGIKDDAAKEKLGNDDKFPSDNDNENLDEDYEESVARKRLKKE